MSASFRVYIDESGDEGFAFHPEGTGSSRWLVISAVVTKSDTDLATVKLLDGVRKKLGRPARQPLHFRELKHEQRVPYVRDIGQADLTTISVLVHKPSLRDPAPFQAEPYRLYRYATRYLLERVSWYCRDHRTPGVGDGQADVIFSNRDRMSYDDLRDYLRRLRAAPPTEEVRIDWSVISPEQVRAVNHDQLMGLQIADAVASGLFFAVNVNRYSEVEEKYAELLAATFYRHGGKTLGYGLKFAPDHWEVLKEKLPHLNLFKEGVLK